MQIRRWRGRSIVLCAFILMAPVVNLAATPAPAGAVKGGTVVTNAAYPYMAEFLLPGTGANAGTFIATTCSGTLIAPTWILTAGHCIHAYLNTPSTLRLKIGSTIVSSVDHVYVEPGWAHPHPDNFVNDIGLVHLSIADTVHAVVKLAWFGDASTWDPCGTTRTALGCATEVSTSKAVTALGYGCTGPGFTCLLGVLPLRRATLNVLTYAQLRSAYHGSGVYSRYVQKPYDKMIIGAGVAGGAVDTCDGDSGGPLLDSGGREIALTDWASPDTCGAATPNGVYMQLGLGPARKWIAATVVSLSRIHVAGTNATFHSTVNSIKPAYAVTYGFAGATGVKALGTTPQSICSSPACVAGSTGSHAGYAGGIEMYVFDKHTGKYCFSSDPNHALVDRLSTSSWRIHWDLDCGQTPNGDYTDLVTTVTST
jgi:secreted trypsin-like serine protease